jgi:hypothetical protein
MSVLTCNRKGCQNIMCDRHSHEYGYICNECFEELVNEENLDIEDFMDSEKGETWLDRNSARRDYLSKIFSIDEEN